jgi:hypothetical protein
MQPQYPQYPAPEQPPAQYPPQYGQPPAPPAQYPPQPPAQYPPQYGQPPAPQYPPQSYAPPPPAAPMAAGSLDQFYSQPSTGGGKALSFETVGTRYVGIVVRPIGDSDIQQQTDTQGRPATFRDGRPKFVMRVPLQMQPSAAYPDGLAQWFVKGNDRDELVRAMAEAGAPEGPPEAGSLIDITFTGTRPSGPGMNPTKIKQVRYQRPSGAVPAGNGHAPVAQVQPAAQVAPVAQVQPVPVNGAYTTTANTTTAMPPPVAVNGQMGQPVQPPPVPAPPPPPVPAPPAPPPPAPVAAPPTVPLDEKQQALLATLTGQTAAPAAPPVPATA